MKLPWVEDPNSKQPSVSLTVFVIATILMIVGAGLEMFVAIKASSLLEELFWAAVMLYFGRKSVSFRGKALSIDPEPKEKAE